MFMLWPIMAYILEVSLLVMLSCYLSMNSNSLPLIGGKMKGSSGAIGVP
jgi:hypothetical protein